MVHWVRKCESKLPLLLIQMKRRDKDSETAHDHIEDVVVAKCDLRKAPWLFSKAYVLYLGSHARGAACPSWARQVALQGASPPLNPKAEPHAKVL